MAIRDYDPDTGMALQGDLVIAPVRPPHYLTGFEETPAVAGRLVLLEGEGTGHAHAIDLHAAPDRCGARLLRDPYLVRRLRKDAQFGLSREDLCVGFLLVEGASVVISHQEHDGIRVPQGLYYLGGQVETSAGGQVRLIQD